jgi:ribosomal protein L7/L12
VSPKSAAAEEEPEDTQTSFTVKLVKFEPDSKIKLIKEVKAQVEGMNLVQVCAVRYLAGTGNPWRTV